MNYDTTSIDVCILSRCRDPIFEEYSNNEYIMELREMEPWLRYRQIKAMPNQLKQEIYIDTCDEYMAYYKAKHDL